MRVDSLHAFFEFGPHPFCLENIIHPFGMVARRRHNQMTGPLPSAFSQLLRVDRLHGLLEFGADLLVLKNIFSLVSEWLQ